MCLIVVHLKGAARISDTDIKAAWSTNSHGAGYMFARDGKLIVRKPFFKLKELRKSYLADYAECGESSAFVIHFRVATSGRKDETNTHPHWLVEDSVALAHNGVLDDFDVDASGTFSDTVWFCNTVLAARDPAQLLDKEFGAWLGGLIGKGNKFALMNGLGEVSIVNESSGTWDGQTWYSNTYWRYKIWSGTGTAGTGKACRTGCATDSSYLFDVPGDEAYGEYWRNTRALPSAYQARIDEEDTFRKMDLASKRAFEDYESVEDYEAHMQMLGLEREQATLDDEFERAVRKW